MAVILEIFSWSVAVEAERRSACSRSSPKKILRLAQVARSSYLRANQTTTVEQKNNAILPAIDIAT